MKFSRSIVTTAVVTGLAGYLVGASRLLEPLTAELSMPKALDAYATSGRTVSPLPIDKDSWRAWEIRPASGPSQLAFGIPDSNAVVVGDLIDESGNNVGKSRLYDEARQRFQFDSLEFQARTVRAHADKPSVVTTAYVVADPGDATFQRHLRRIAKLADTGYPVAIIPIVSAEAQSYDPLSRTDSFDALQIIFSAGTHNSDTTPYQELQRIASGGLVIRPAGASIASNRQSFEAITKNLQLANWLGLTDQPYVISRGADNGLKVTPMGEWLEKVDHQAVQGKKHKEGQE